MHGTELRRWWLFPVAAACFMGLVIVAAPHALRALDADYDPVPLRPSNVVGLWTGQGGKPWVMILANGKAYVDTPVVGSFEDPDIPLDTPAGYLAGLPMTWSITKAGQDSAEPGADQVSLAFIAGDRTDGVLMDPGSDGDDLYDCSYGGVVELQYAGDPDSPCAGPEQGFWLDHTGNA